MSKPSGSGNVSTEVDGKERFYDLSALSLLIAIDNIKQDIGVGVLFVLKVPSQLILLARDLGVVSPVELYVELSLDYSEDEWSLHGSKVLSNEQSVWWSEGA